MLEQIRGLFFDPGLRLELRPEWGRDHAALHMAAPENSSLSHTEGLGGYVYSELAYVGLDIERTARVHQAVARRVSTSDGPMPPAVLWTAKEACFKALRGPRQPRVVSELIMDSWQKIDSQFETVALRNWNEFAESAPKSVVFTLREFTVCIFSFKK